MDRQDGDGAADWHTLAQTCDTNSHRLVGDGDATFDHELVDIAVAMGEAVVQPHAMAHDLHRDRWRVYSSSTGDVFIAQ